MDVTLETQGIALFRAGEALLERQTSIRDFAKEHNMTVIAFFAIDSVTTGSIMRHALKLCEEKRASAIIFDEPKTFYLSVKDLISVLFEIERQGLAIIFAQENIHLKPSLVSAMYQIFLGSVACENEVRSQKIKISLQKKKKRGARLGGKKFGLVAHESRVIHQILKFHTEGASLQRICDLLENNDIKTTQNKKWYPTTIKRIIERNKKH